MRFKKYSVEAFERNSEKRKKSKIRVKLHLDRWYENRLVSQDGKKEFKIHQNFQASKYGVKQSSDAI